MPPTQPTRPTTPRATPKLPPAEDGFMLLGLIVAIAIILLTLSVAASKVAFSLHREREEESVRRANQYVRAIQLYYKKLGHYPSSIQQLENTNNVRYLRKEFVDPLTGKADWRIIIAGQNKTTVKGFFGQPLAGIASPGLGALAGSLSTGGGFPGGPGGSAALNATPGSSQTGPNSTGTSSTAAGSTGADTTSTPGQSTPAGGPNSAFNPGSTGLGSGSSGPIMGVGSSATGTATIVVNEQTAYQDWEFLYDPRVDQLKAQQAMLNGGGVGSAAAGSLGQTPGAIGSTTPGSSTTGTTPGANPTNPTTPNQP